MSYRHFTLLAFFCTVILVMLVPGYRRVQSCELIPFIGPTSSGRRGKLLSFIVLFIRYSVELKSLSPPPKEVSTVKDFYLVFVNIVLCLSQTGKTAF